MVDRVPRIQASSQQRVNPLEPGELIRYLLGHKLLDSKSIVDGDLVVQAVHRRNANYRIIRTGDPSYFVKMGSERGGWRTTAHEHAVYRLLNEASTNPRLRSALPECYGYYPDTSLLIIECIGDSEDLRLRHVRLGRFPKSVASELGKVLAALHGIDISQSPFRPIDNTLLDEPAWALAIHRPSPIMLEQASNAVLEMLVLIQQNDELCRRLDELQGEWQATCFIHNDIRWDNILVAPGRPRPKGRLTIVDWELAGRGDPAWDVAGVFNAYLSCWLLSMPITGGSSSDQFVKLAKYPLHRMQPAVRAFWSSYIDSRNLGQHEAEHLMLRSVRYTSARLLQTAYESLQTEYRLNGNAVCMLQVSLSMLQRPAEAVVHLLGIQLGLNLDGDN